MATDAKLLVADEDAREAALDVARSFIVQAPAGSGKTELLIQRYLRLLSVVSDPEEILAITFTRKAAAEMQVRVLRALRAAEAGEQPSAPHEQVTAEAARAALEHDRRLEWGLLENPRRMRIQTLDALNASIARAQPLTVTGGAADTSIIADAQMRALYREAAALTLDQLGEPGDLQRATREVLAHVDTNAGLYIAYLSRMLATRDQWLPFVGSGLLHDKAAASLRRQFEEGLRLAVTAHLEQLARSARSVDRTEIVALANYAGENIRNSDTPTELLARLATLGDLPSTDAECVADWLALAELLLTQQGGWRKTANKNQGFPPKDDGEKARLKEVLEGLADDYEFRDLLNTTRHLPPLSYSDEQWDVLLALFRLLPLAATELKRLFAERSVADHIEIALSANSAIGTADAPGDIALLLDYQIRHVLVDEMQDTSSAQYRMIEALTGGWGNDDGRTLYCVGDPMQSIYRFRNAEVGQFLRARTAGIGSVPLEPLTLRRNFRSGEHLVDWFNAVFPNVLSPRDDAQQSAVAYERAISVPALANDGRCVVHPVFGADPAAEADTGLRVVRDILEQDPDGDIAILVRGRSHLPQLLYRLRREGISYRAIEIDRLTDLPEIIDVLALTRALVHQGDRHAWLALLRAPWAGLDWTDIHTLVNNRPEQTVWELLVDDEVVAGLSQRGGNAVARLRNVIAPYIASNRAETLRDRVERLWMTLGGPSIAGEAHAVDNVYHFLDVLEKLEVAGDLPDVGELESVLDGEHVSSNADARLQVMTMHRAKGLQFDHVVLYGLGRIPRPRESSVLSWFDLRATDGQALKIISPVGPRADIEKDPVHNYIGKIETAKDKNELARLLYVACTRARRSLHLVGHARVLKSGMRPDQRSLLHLLWPAVQEHYDAAFDEDLAAESDSSDDGEWLIPPLRRFASGWQLPEPPLAVAPPKRTDTSSNPQVEFYWVGTHARIAGTLYHRWMQHLVDRNVAVDSLDEQALNATTLRWLREEGISGAAADSIRQRTLEAVQATLADDKGRWLLDGEGHAELALTGVVDGQLESVVLDRVRIDEQGQHWVVDFKTSSHEGGRLDAFLQAETDRYRPQLTRYAEIYARFADVEVRCALYFPLLRKFVEVDL